MFLIGERRVERRIGTLPEATAEASALNFLLTGRSLFSRSQPSALLVRAGSCRSGCGAEHPC